MRKESKMENDDFIIAEDGEIYSKKERAFSGVWIPKEVYLIDTLSWIEKILLC